MREGSFVSFLFSLWVFFVGKDDQGLHQNINVFAIPSSRVIEVRLYIRLQIAVGRPSWRLNPISHDCRRRGIGFAGRLLD